MARFLRWLISKLWRRQIVRIGEDVGEITTGTIPGPHPDTIDIKDNRLEGAPWWREMQRTNARRRSAKYGT